MILDRDYYLYPQPTHLIEIVDFDKNDDWKVVGHAYYCEFGEFPLPKFPKKYTEEELEGYLAHLKEWFKDDYIAGGFGGGAPSFKEWRDGRAGA
jgi:hypothetical protein